MSNIKVKDKIYHPCSIDIIPHEVTSVREFDGFKHYVLKSKGNVGACGIIEVVVDEHNGKLRFVELVDEDEIEHASGLQDFVEGNYYTSLEEAKLEFYNLQRNLALSNMYEKERLYNESVKRYNQVDKLVSELREFVKAVK